MVGSKKKEDVNVTTDMYVGQKLISLKNLVKENKTIVSVCVLSGLYYLVNQYIL
jgi:hypothetical protein